MHFISTVLPEPLWPMMRFVLPLSKMLLMSCSTSLSSKDLYRDFTSIIRVCVWDYERSLVSNTSENRMKTLLLTTDWGLALPTSTEPPSTVYP